MWLDEHSKHHAMTMCPREDPQFNYLPLWMVSLKELDKWNTLNAVEKVAARYLVPFQHITLLPLSLLIGRFNLHIVSIVYALKRCLLVDLAGLALYGVWFCGLLCTIPSAERVWFVMVCLQLQSLWRIPTAAVS